MASCRAKEIAVLKIIYAEKFDESPNSGTGKRVYADRKGLLNSNSIFSNLNDVEEVSDIGGSHDSNSVQRHQDGVSPLLNFISEFCAEA